MVWWNPVLPVPDIVGVQELQRLQKLPHDDNHLLCAHLAPAGKCYVPSTSGDKTGFSAEVHGLFVIMLCAHTKPGGSRPLSQQRRLSDLMV